LLELNWSTDIQSSVFMILFCKRPRQLNLRTMSQQESNLLDLLAMKKILVMSVLAIQ
jgi:hypothetical protein